MVSQLKIVPSECFILIIFNLLKVLSFKRIKIFTKNLYIYTLKFIGNIAEDLED